MDLPKIDSVDFSGKTVLLRADVDFDTSKLSENVRYSVLLETLKYILKKDVKKIILFGHKGRPKSEPKDELSLLPLVDILKNEISEDVYFITYEMFNGNFKNDFVDAHQRVYLLENVRFWEGEELNDFGFVDKFRDFEADVYVNEAFASSHREHATIVSVPGLVETKCAGIRFVQEVETLGGVFGSPKSPVVSVISGVKEDKLSYIDDFKGFSDKVLVGGRLPDYLPDADDFKNNEKMIVARLMPDKEDITINTIEKFEEEISKAGTVVLAGPIGKYEDEGHRQGTFRVFKAIAESNAVKLAGGGDTAKALSLFGLLDKFDWVSVGGGAALEFLSKRDLPGAKALLN